LIDADVQRYAERLAAEMLRDLPPSVNVSVVVVRNSDAAIVAYVGGADYTAEGRAGQVDLAQAIRSPGSTLKPFIYGLGFELLAVHPYTIITDAPVGFGNYAPQNFGGDYAGDLTIRDALIRSINTGAVALLRRVEPQRLISRLRVAGLPLEIQETDAAAGLAIGLGGAGVRLLDLARAYSALANGGVSRPLRILADAPEDAGTKLMDADAAWAVTDILADMPPPNGFVRPTSDDGGRRIAYKTGTSYAFRDAWAVGYDVLHTVGVWVGRPDGAPHVGAYGATAAAPLLFRLFERLPTPQGDVAGAPPGESILSARQPPERLIRFDAKPLAASIQPLRIVFPQDGSTVVAQVTSHGSLTLPLIAQGGAPPYQLYLDNLALDRPHLVGRIAWAPQGRGAAKLAITDASGSRAEVNIWVEVPTSDATASPASAGSSEKR
jgi:penicillin-binding protein 1C